jgi:hypothetical protein
MSRLTHVIAPLLARAGLDVRVVNGADGPARELVITNPRQPGWGKAVIDHDGHTQWDYWGQLHDDHGAADIATVIIAIMATRPGTGPARHARTARPAAPGDLSRPHAQAPVAQRPPTAPQGTDIDGRDRGHQ